MRALVLLLFAIPLTAQQSAKHSYPPIHACGITAHALFDGKPLGELEPAFQSAFLTALRPKIQQEAKAADVIAPAAISTNQLNHSLLVTKLTTEYSKPIFAIMWEEPQICGGHENCAWWLVRQDGQHLTVLSDTTNAPQTGWAAGLQRTPDGKEILLAISSITLRREAACMALQDNQLLNTACAPHCDANAEANQPD